MTGAMATTAKPAQVPGEGFTDVAAVAAVLSAVAAVMGVWRPHFTYGLVLQVAVTVLALLADWQTVALGRAVWRYRRLAYHVRKAGELAAALAMSDADLVRMFGVRVTPAARRPRAPKVGTTGP